MVRNFRVQGTPWYLCGIICIDVQFLQIQTVLQNTGEEGQDELVKLRDDLVELIHVSEGAYYN